MIKKPFIVHRLHWIVHRGKFVLYRCGTVLDFDRKFSSRLIVVDQKNVSGIEFDREADSCCSRNNQKFVVDVNSITMGGQNGRCSHGRNTAHESI